MDSALSKDNQNVIQRPKPVFPATTASTSSSNQTPTVPSIAAASTDAGSAGDQGTSVSIEMRDDAMIFIANHYHKSSLKHH